MCIFSFDFERFGQVDPIKVEGTRIFARGLADGRQALVYSMRYSSQVDMAMVLPLPSPAAPREDAVDFIDFSEYEDFFDDLERGFTDGAEAPMYLSIGDSPSPPRVLEVHNVGSFEASFVPTRSDFSRLDVRFRLSDGVLNALPIYRDYSFAVFKLKSGHKRVHPMALSFPRKNAKELFFPTVHVHDGTVPESAHFDHTLYCQSRGISSSPGWDTSGTLKRKEVELEEWFREYAKGFGRPIESYTEDQKRRFWNLRGYDSQLVEVPANASQFMDIHRAKGLVDDGTVVMRKQVHGREANNDLVLADA